MAENNSIDNLSRQDLLTVLEGFIKQAKQINKIKDEYNSRYVDIANKVLLTEYKKPKNLVIAYFIAPFYVLKGKKYKKVGTSSDRLTELLLKDFLQNGIWMMYKWVGWAFGLLGDISLIQLLFFPIGSIIDLSRGLSPSADDLGELLLGILLGIIGYFMGRKKYMQHWFEKVIKKGNYDNEIDAAVDSDPQIIDYKNKLTSLVSDATYQQYRSLIPEKFTLGDIMGIYQMLFDYRANNFKEAVNAWRQEQHNKRVENKMNENNKKISQMEANITNLAKRQDKAEAVIASTEAAIASTLAQTKQATEMAQAANAGAQAAFAQAAGANAEAASARAQAASANAQAANARAQAAKARAQAARKSSRR
ncbi:hypothetical protein [Lactobacillus equicursoris]|uniref:hypothetical protein n=1 Tax=Lactobacillus equicursoris TaxID=420645 RepID=UPI0039914CDB